VLQRADTLDLDSLNLPPGGGGRVDVHVRVEPLELGGQRYDVGSGGVEARVEVSRTISGYAFRLRFDASLSGHACDASPTLGPAFTSTRAR
jgi:hypothetical protein